MTSVKFSDMVSFAWSYTSSRCTDIYRNAFSEALSVTTKSGPVKGFKIPSAFDFHYYNFCGIPYAKPPIGDLRFKVWSQFCLFVVDLVALTLVFDSRELCCANYYRQYMCEQLLQRVIGYPSFWLIQDPQPFEPSNEVINHQFARHGSLACQNGLISHRPIGNENCLHLNVYTLDVKPDALKPVMVWIHGGAFVMGSNSKELYNPELLLRKNVIVICINYRLGAIGMFRYCLNRLKKC